MALTHFCGNCGHSIDIDAPFCERCGIAQSVAGTSLSTNTPIDINVVIRTGNPYAGPIRTISSQLGKIEWRFPFLTQTLVFLVSCLILVILTLLYITLGLVAQVSSIFSHLIQQARLEMRGKPAIEKTGYIVAIGIYFAIWAPLWIVQLPFFTLGWLWEILERMFR